VGDAEHFKKAMDVGLEVPPDLAQIPRPILGFVGAVSNYKLNLDWLIYTAQQKPQWHIVLIGPVGKADPHTSLGQLKKYPNIHVLGHRSYSQLPSYLKGIDVAIIPYRKNQYTASVFPIKFFEFLATGKPVVISDLPALENYYDQVLMAATPQEFIHCCETALVMGTKGQADRITLAEQNSWPSRVKQLLHHVETKLCGPNG
jgi:glycosyltransferase involved in cell wall biosynthesis